MGKHFGVVNYYIPEVRLSSGKIYPYESFLSPFNPETVLPDYHEFWWDAVLPTPPGDGSNYSLPTRKNTEAGQQTEQSFSTPRTYSFVLSQCPYSDKEIQVSRFQV